VTSPFLRRLDLDALDADYPSGPDFLTRYVGMSTDELRALQEQRFARVLDTAWRTPFYRRVWGAAGIEAGDITGLDDLAALPIIDKSVIVADIDEHPPFGSLVVVDGSPTGPRVLQTTSGTTGRAQPVLWGPWGRETQNALLGRLYQWLGVGADDVVHSVYGHGLVNGGHYAREAVTRWTEAVMLSAGTGNETSSVRQVQAMAQFGATALIGFADYFRRLAEVAADEGLVPGVDLPVRMIVGQLPAGSREALEQAWPGAKAYDWYGVADTGIVSAEGPARDGHHVWSDAFVLELLDPEGGEPVDDGQLGDMVVTSLAKHDLAPLVRFNTHDLTSALPGRGAADLPFLRTTGMQGRSDQMVKLRGINVYPTAIAAHLTNVDGALGEYVCRLERRSDGAEHLVVVVEHASPSEAASAAIAEQLSTQLGVRVGAQTVALGETAELTGLLVRQKPTRLIDARS
jgi:phenylacetate-CoA ligase